MPKTQTKQNLEKLNRLIRAAWFFPIVLGVFFLIMSVFQISGSSIGTYDSVLGGSNSHDHVLLGKPQPIRSDEWLFVTQMTIAQHAAGYPYINENIDYGRNMSLVGDAPYLEWSTVFRPQNLAFYVLPLEFAFAFKWWLLLYLTIVSVYFFVRRMLPDKHGLAVVLSLAFGCSPFFFWWYQTATFAPVFYGLFMAILGMRIINREKVWGLANKPYYISASIYATVLTYLLTCFVLILYPPFQIPIGLVLAAFLGGYYFENFSSRKALTSRESLGVIITFVASMVGTALIVLLFIATRHDAINALTHTIYPGTRDISGGGLPIVEFFNTYLQPQLQRGARATHYYANQSEASNFILALPFLLLPSFYVITRAYKRNRSVSWSFIGVQLVAVLFIADLFFSGLKPLYDLVLLNKVPHERLFIGLGFVGLFQLVLFIKFASDSKVWNTARYKSRAFLGCYLVGVLAITVGVGQYIRHHYPLFLQSKPLLICLAGLYCLFIAGLLLRRWYIALIALLILSVGSVFHIHPFQRGLGPLYNSDIIHAIDSVSKPTDNWVVVDDILFENLPVLSNRNSLSGIQLYPDLSFWSQVDGAKKQDIYNRYAHVLFNSDPAFKDKIQLIQIDSFQVKFSCYGFIEKNVQFALATHPINNGCSQLVKTVKYPNKTFYIYAVK